MGLAHPLYALDWRFHVFRGSLSAYVSCATLRFISQTARTDLDFRLPDFASFNGRSIFRLPAALGTNVLLGGTSDCQFILCHSFYRPRFIVMDSWRLCGKRRDA